MTHLTPGAARLSVSCLFMPSEESPEIPIIAAIWCWMSPAQLQPSVTRSPAGDDGKVAPQTDKICADGPCRAFYSIYTHRRFCREKLKWAKADPCHWPVTSSCPHVNIPYHTLQHYYWLYHTIALLNQKIFQHTTEWWFWGRLADEIWSLSVTSSQ